MSALPFRFGFVLLVALAPLPAAAQPVDTIAGAGPETQVLARSPTRAALYSLGATVLPVASGVALMRVNEWTASRGRIEVGTDLSQLGATLLLGGLVAGPAAGHFYAGNRRHAYAGLGIRGGATVVGVGAATVILLDTSLDFFSYGEPRLSRTGRIAEDVLAGALVVMVGSAIVDVFTAPLSAYRYNEANTLRARVAPRLSPTFEQAGLAVHLRF